MKISSTKIEREDVIKALRKIEDTCLLIKYKLYYKTTYDSMDYRCYEQLVPVKFLKRYRKAMKEALPIIRKLEDKPSRTGQYFYNKAYIKNDKIFVPELQIWYDTIKVGTFWNPYTEEKRYSKNTTNYILYYTLHNGTFYITFEPMVNVFDDPHGIVGEIHKPTERKVSNIFIKHFKTYTKEVHFNSQDYDG